MLFPSFNILSHSTNHKPQLVLLLARLCHSLDRADRGAPLAGEPKAHLQVTTGKALFTKSLDLWAVKSIITKLATMR